MRDGRIYLTSVNILPSSAINQTIPWQLITYLNKLTQQGYGIKINCLSL